MFCAPCCTGERCVLVLSSKTGVAAVSVAVNVVLVLLKLAVGFAIGSVGVISEAVHSAIDLVAAVMALFAVRNSARPPDEDHHFGHGKVESLAGVAQALLIFLAALLIINEAVQKLLHGVELPAVDLGIAVMVVSTVANLAAARWVMRVARAADSMALEADAWHHTTDVLTSAGVALGLVVVRFTGLSVLDPLIAIAVALFICKAAYDITRRSLADLLDTSLPEDEQKRIRRVLDRHSEEMAEIVDYHRLRSRKAGAERHVDLHLVVKRDATVQESHELCDHLEEHLREELGPVSLNIHVEPCEEPCARCDTGCTTEKKTG